MQAPKGRILILDDDVLVAMNNKDILEGLGYKCRLAHKLQDAWHFIKHNNYCMLLCDHDLPDGKGINLVKKIAVDKPQLPIIYLSAAPPSTLQEVRDCKTVKEILAKPISKERLISAVEQLKLRTEFTPHRLISAEERQLLLEIHPHESDDE